MTTDPAPKTRQTRINADLYAQLGELAPALGCSSTREVIEFACRLLARDMRTCPYRGLQAPASPLYQAVRD
jgi:hypothetical protein